MLVPILFLVALMASLCGALLESGLLAAKIAFQTSVSRSSDTAMANGVADFTATLAQYVRDHGTDGPWPAAASRSFPATLCPAATACPFGFVVVAQITGALRHASDASGTDAALNLQVSAIAEGRVSARVTTTITGGDGRVLGTRSRALTYRVFAAPPYAILSGARDSSAADTASAGSAPADSGGALPVTRLNATRDTRVHVVLQCSAVPAQAGVAAGNDGLPWGNAGQAHETVCPGAASPADAFVDGRWTNGDTSASGWTF